MAINEESKNFHIEHLFSVFSLVPSIFYIIFLSFIELDQIVGIFLIDQYVYVCSDYGDVGGDLDGFHSSCGACSIQLVTSFS
ncbi:unnamed protein product, partial [Adineta ricciae]